MDFQRFAYPRPRSSILPDRRRISRDPIGEEGGLNVYDYVLNNPVNRIDPLGLEDQCTDCKGNPKKGPGIGQKCCGKVPPMPNTASNPYGPNDRYFLISAQLMFDNGGNGPWGNIVRGCLVCMLSHGAGMNEAHFYCYINASKRVPASSTASGLSNAVGAAALDGVIDWFASSFSYFGGDE